MAPMSFLNLRLIGDFSYGFYEHSNISSDYDIAAILSCDAQSATFSQSAVSLPNANILHLGHNPGLL